MADANNLRLKDLAEENQVILIADPDHEDGLIRKSITSQLQAMHDEGVRHLYLEHDPKDVSLDQLLALPDEQGDLVREATRLNMQVHLFDDRSREHQLEARHPAAASFADDVDPYHQDRDALIWKSANPSEMNDYLRDADTHWKADSITYRNEKMIENLSHEINQHPDEKSLIIAGSSHSNEGNDIDEGLRKNGHQVITARVNTQYTSYSSWGTDNPDFVIHGDTGKAISYKDPESGNMRRMTDTDELPIKNTEPVNELPPESVNKNTHSASQNNHGIVNNNHGIPDHIRDYLIIRNVSQFISSTDNLSAGQRDFMNHYLSEKQANITQPAEEQVLTKELGFT